MSYMRTYTTMELFMIQSGYLRPQNVDGAEMERNRGLFRSSNGSGMVRWLPAGVSRFYFYAPVKTLERTADGRIVAKEIVTMSGQQAHTSQPVEMPKADNTISAPPQSTQTSSASQTISVDYQSTIPNFFEMEEKKSGSIELGGSSRDEDDDEYKVSKKSRSLW
ncbi:hypothetical protein ACKC9G_15005 [Pokkaliibacter sp. CJK22405]|uniref:hypothetical protein n=1 Tax=Pokkaliibacter sp. CJK22405 TaxID=3384615 RepID=UPI003984BC17